MDVGQKGEIKMTRNYKKAISLLMAVVMTMSSAIPCFAETQQFESIVDEIVETDNSEQTDLSGLIGEIAIEIPDSEEEIVEDEVIKDNKSEVFSIDETPAQEIKQQGELSEENSELFEHEEELLSGSGYEGIIISDGVTEIAAGAYANLNITSIKIPDSVETIGAEAFKGCTNLESVEFGKNIKTIGYSAFSGCTSLKKAILPEGLEKLGTSASGSNGSDGVFYNCTSLEEVYIPSTLTQGYNAFYGCSSLSKVTFGEELTIIPKYLFAKSGLKEIEIPDSITEIGESAFSGCTELASVAFSKGLKKIGGEAFSGCTSLTKIDLPEGLETLANVWSSNGRTRYGVFENCTSLEDVYIPSTLIEGANAFSGCSNLKKVTFGEGIEKIPDELFYGSGIEEAEIPNSITEIGAGAFSGCTKLESVEFGKNIKTIGYSAFSGCTSLKKAILPEGLEKLGTSTSGSYGSDGVFYNCTSLEEVYIPSTLTQGYNAFYGCSSLSKVTFGEELTIIPAYLFAKSGLKEIEIPDSITEIGESAFSGCTELSELSIINGTWFDFSRIFNLNSAYEWSSKDTSVAEISQSGVVSTHKPGETIITAVSESTTVLEIKLTVRKGGTEEANPVAVISPSGILNVYTGFSIKVSAENSSAVGGIQSFEWNFGDGTVLTGETAEHSYSTKGDYTLALKVTDYSGNESVVQTVVNVSDPDENHTVVAFSVCDAQTKNPVKGATITFENTEGNTIQTITDENGLIKVVLKNGEYDISIISPGYLARYTTHIFDGNPVDWTIGLSTTNVMTGEFTVTEMTREEIIAAGIDVNAEGNQHVYKFATVIQFKFDDSFIERPIEIYKNESGEIIKSNGGWYERSGGHSGGSSGGSSSGNVDNLPLSSNNRRKIGIFPVSENYVLIIYGETHWLKEMYQAELVVTNNSLVDTLEDVTAEIQLPDGLSLADMLSGQQSEVMTIDKVPEDSSDSFIWYLRGDKEGEYNVSVDVSAKQMPFGDEIHCHYTTDKPVKVYAGSQMKMTITADNKAIEGYYYHVNYKLENVSPKSLYYLCLKLNSAEQWAYEDTSITVGDIPEWSFPSEGEYVLKRTDELEDYVSVDELAPGQTVEINMKVPIDFIDGEDSPLMKAFLPEKVEFLVKHFDVYTLEGSTTEIPYEINLVDPILEKVIEEDIDDGFLVRFISPSGQWDYSFEDGLRTYTFYVGEDKDEIKVELEVVEGAEWELYYDKECTILMGKDSPHYLSKGDNKWYIKVVKEEEERIYCINIFKGEKISKRLPELEIKNLIFENGETVQINWGSALFSHSATVYDKNLDFAALYLAEASEKENTDDTIREKMGGLGFDNIFSNRGYWSKEINIPGATIGATKFTDETGEKYLFCVTIRGTQKGTGDIITDLNSVVDGFRPSGKNIYHFVTNYIEQFYPDANGENTVFFINGHSLGGATAGVLATLLSGKYKQTQTFVYTFASPCYLPFNNNIEYSNVFNTVNINDIIPTVSPIWHRVGICRKYSSAINYLIGDVQLKKKVSDGLIGDFISDFLGMAIDKVNLAGNVLEGLGHIVEGLAQFRFNFGDFLTEHETEMYLDLMKNYSPINVATEFWDLGKNLQISAVLCPVDVKIYDESDQLIAETIGEEAYNYGGGGLLLMTSGDKKVIINTGDRKYRIEFVGTDDGAMTFLTGLYDNEEINDLKVFTDVALEEGKNFNGTIGLEVPIENVKLFVEDDFGNVIAEVKESGEETSIEDRSYTVTWKNWDGTELEKDTSVAYGTIPTYDGATPTKEATAQYTYAFDGWDKTVAAITEDVVYTAKFKETVNKYTVIFKDWDGTELKKTEVEYGSAAEAPSDPERVGYTFIGWDKAFDNITGELTVTAQYADKVVDVTIAVEGAGYGSISGNKATVKYGTTISADGAKLTVGNTTITATPTADTAQYAYSIKEWRGIPEDGKIVTEITITAVFERRVQNYTVTWKNEDGTILETDRDMEYGATPTYDGATPTKPSDAQYSYTFAGWDKVIAAVTGDVTYTAQFNAVVQRYTVTWKNWNGSILETDEAVAYGAAPMYDGATPTKPADAQYSYAFAGWDKAICILRPPTDAFAEPNRLNALLTDIWQIKPLICLYTTLHILDYVSMARILRDFLYH